MTNRLAIITDDGEPLVSGGEYLVAPEAVVSLSDHEPDASFFYATDDDYTGLLWGFLPRGWAWNRRPGSNLSRMVEAIAAGFARVHRAAVHLLQTEADPRTTRDLLPEWERMLGLPDLCTGIPDTLQERRLLVTARYTATGGQSPAYFIGLAAALSYPSVTIEEGTLFRCDDPDSRCDESPLNEPGWAYAWIVHAPAVSEIAFRCDESCADEPLLTFGNQRLECAINRARPAHTIVHFAYGE